LGTGSAAVTTTSTFVKNRLASMSVSKNSVAQSKSTYGYDAFGRLESITGRTGSDVLASSTSCTYDGFDRTVGEKSDTYGSDGVADGVVVE